MSARQLLVKVSAASVNPIDVRIHRTKLFKRVMPLPKIPGCDFCGTVEDIDAQCTRGFAKGDLIVGTLNPLAYTKYGTMAEFLA